MEETYFFVKHEDSMKIPIQPGFYAPSTVNVVDC
jgi:hypothetical protein